jgi:hypothetical protein
MNKIIEAAPISWSVLSLDDYGSVTQWLIDCSLVLGHTFEIGCVNFFDNVGELGMGTKG